MFSSAGGGGKRIGSNKQNLHQQQQPQLQPHQNPSHAQQTHQLLQHHIPTQQQQLQNNTIIHHNKQTPPQSATNAHTVLVQHQQKPSAPPPQYPHPKIPITFLSYPLGNVHASSAAAGGQHRPVQTTIGNVPQMSPSPTGFVCSNTDVANSTRPTGINTSTHYMSQTPNNNIMNPAYHLHQNAHLMVTTPYNNVAAATASNGSGQLNIPAGATLYPTTQQPQTQPSNPQQALQYFSNNSVPLHSLQPHPPQQIRNMFTMVAPARHPYLISPNCFSLPHATTLPPQALTNASPAMQGLATVAGNGASVNTQMQTATQRNTVLAGPTTYVHAPYCTPPLDVPITQTSGDRPKQRSHAIPIINPHTMEEVNISSKEEAKVNKQDSDSSSTETNCELVDDTDTQNENHRISEQITYEDVSVQTEEDDSLTDSIVSDCSEMITHTHPTTDTAKHDDEKLEIRTSVNDTDENLHLDEVDLSTADRNYQKTEEIILEIANENNQQLKPDEEDHCKEVNNIPEINTATSIVSSNPQSTSGTESLKICIYGDPYDTDADANEHELDDDLDVDHSKELENKSASCSTPNKLNGDKLNQNIINESKANVLSKQTNNSSKKGSKRCKKNKKKSKQQQQQQHLKISETNNKLNKNSPIKTNNNNSLIEASDNMKTPTTTAANNKTGNQSEQPKSSTSSSIEKPKNQKTSKTLETKADTKHLQNKSRPSAEDNDKRRFIRYTMDQLKDLSKLEESNKIPTVRCQKGGCISQLFVARQQQQHFHHSHSFTTNQHHHTNASVNKTPLIRINLSLREEIQLSRSNNAWQPKALKRKSNQMHDNSAGNTDEELKKVRGILNKLTLDNFQVLVKSMKEICLNSQETIEKVMVLIFEKTVSEPNFAPIYAKFCHVLFQEVKPEIKTVFNTLLIRRLQTEFENNVSNPNAKSSTLQHIVDKLNQTNDPKEKQELSEEYDLEEYKFRRRAWGTVKFIGEMYKLNCLTSDRALQCVESLLNNGNEEKLEYLCKLLTTVGPQLDGNGHKARVNIVFRKIQNIVKDAKSAGKQKLKISSRVRFMLEDIMDLRSRNWDLKSSSTITSLSSTAPMRATQQQHKNHFSTSSTNLSNFERANNQRMGGFGNNHRQGRNNNNMNMKESGGHFVQKSIDIKKLNFSRGVDEASLTSTTLGNMSMYRWRSETQQSGRNSPTSSQKSIKANGYETQVQNQPQSSFNEVKSQRSPTTDVKSVLDLYSAKDNQKLVNHLIEEYLDCLPSRSILWQEEIFKTWQNTKQNQQICVIYYILMDYLHKAHVKEQERNACSSIFIYLLRYGALNKKTFVRAYELFAEDFPDLLTDVPNGWSYIFEFIGPILHEDLLKFNDIWFNMWRNDKIFTERFVKALVLYFTTKYGANYMRDLWHKEFKLDYGQIFTADRQQWQQFIEANNFQFIYDCNMKPTLNTTANTKSSSVEQHVQRLEVLLNSFKNSNLALDYINTNVNINSNFLKQLTRFLCCYSVTMQATTAINTTAVVSNKNSSTCSSSSGSKSVTKSMPQLNIEIFRKKCLPLLRFCLDGNEDYEIVCLDTIVVDMQQEYDVHNAFNLICNIFELLYDSELIPKESFEKWYRQWRQQQQQKCNDTNVCELQAFMQKIL